MSNSVILLAETGSDITPEIAREYGITLVPMHVTLGSETKDDGTFPPEEICAYYDKTGKAPTTSGSTPFDFETVYEKIFSQDPNARVLYLAYSAVTTCSFHSSQLALEEKPYASNVRAVDTRHVSVGQCAVVVATAKWLRQHPDATLEEAAQTAETIGKQVQMRFIPKNLDYLRAGGRVSNAVALVGNLLNLHPCIDIVDGKLIAGKKYRGAMEKSAAAMIRDFVQKHDPDRSHVYLINTPYMDPQVKIAAEAAVKGEGFQSFTWLRTGCVITCHGGPGAMGIVGTVK